MRDRIQLRRWVGGIALSLLAFGGVVHASAPADQYAFFSAQATEIQDAHTKLIWERRVGTTPDGYGNAENHCSGLGTGWRLPTLKELLTLVDEETYGVCEGSTMVYRAIDRNAFPGTPVGNFWTASPRAGNPNEIWVVNFENGETATRFKTESAYVRCVKNAP